MSADFADFVAKLCYDKFRKLPKAGMPQTSKEWTLLAGIVVSFEDPDKNMKIVSLCTGTKCLGYDQLEEDDVVKVNMGTHLKMDHDHPSFDDICDKTCLLCHEKLQETSHDAWTKCIHYNPFHPEESVENYLCNLRSNIIFDSHAEILAKRAFKRYIYQQASDVLEGISSETFQWDARNAMIKMKPGIKFHLFISNVPCGDAAIFPKEATEKCPSSSKPDFNGTNKTNVKKMRKDESKLVSQTDKCSEKRPLSSNPEFKGTNEMNVKKMRKDESELVSQTEKCFGKRPLSPNPDFNDTNERNVKKMRKNEAELSSQTEKCSEKCSLSSNNSTNEMNVKKMRKDEAELVSQTEKCSEKCSLSSNPDFNSTNEINVKKVRKDEAELVSQTGECSEKSVNLLEKSPSKEFNDIYRTGAKCVENGQQDPKGAGADYHVVGALRTKPGRGSPTWSMSCSDKIALWNICGIQGAILSLVLSKPVYLSSIVFGKCPFNKEAVERAILGRLSNLSNLPSGYKVNKPKILQSTIPFEFSKEVVLAKNEDVVRRNKITPCPASIVFLYVPYLVNVIVIGKLQGATKKNRHKVESRSGVCKRSYFESFRRLCYPETRNNRRLRINTDGKETYLDFKLEAKSYQKAKKAVLTVFKGWKRKPDRFQQFTIKNNNQ